MSEKLGKIDIPRLNEAYQKVLLWFFNFPNDELSLSDLASNLAISKSTANKVITRLISEGFLKKKVFGKAWSISCNQMHSYNHSLKVAYNLMMISNSKIIEEVHNVARSSRAIILFGSYRKGDDTEKSDIDIAVEVLDSQTLKIQKLGVLSNFGYRQNVTVNLHIFSRNNIDLNLFSNISNGIVLDGFLEVKP